MCTKRNVTCHLRGNLYAVMSCDVSATNIESSDVVIQFIFFRCGIPNTTLGLPNNESSSVCLERSSTDMVSSSPLLFGEPPRNVSAKSPFGSSLLLVVVDCAMTVGPISQQRIDPSLPPDTTSRSLVFPNSGKSTDATEESCPSGKYPVCTKLRFSTENIGMLPSPRPAARSLPLGLHAREYTIGGLHTWGLLLVSPLSGCCIV